MTIDSRFYELINHLWRGGKYSYFWTPDDGTGAKVSWWLTLPQSDEVPRFFLDKDAYFAVNPSTVRKSEHERAKVADIAAINCLYCEFDCMNDEERKAARAKIKSLPFQPACVVASGGGYQAYVLLRDTFTDTSRAAELQWAFAQLAGGDTSVNDLARVLRIPGTTNHKPKYAPNFPLVAIVEWDMTQLHDMADIEAVLQPILVQRDAAKAHTPPAGNGGTVSLSDIQMIDVLFQSRNGAMYERLWNGRLDDAGGDHSKADQKLCNGLAWVTGRDIARMDSLFRQSGLYRPKWETKSYQEKTLKNAADSAQTVYDPSHNSQIDPQAVAAAQAAVNMNGNGSGSPGTSAPPPTTPPPQTPNTVFEALSYDDLIRLPPKKWLIERVVGENDIFMLYGEPGSGKSLIVIDMIFAACQGRQWARQFNVIRPLQVAYCAGEGVSGLPDRFRSAADFWGISTLPNFYFFKMVPQLFAKQRSDSITTFIKEWQAQPRPKLDLLIIDTQHTATAGADENSAKDMGEVLDAIRVAMRQLDCSVLVIHHTTKDGERERGSSSLHGAMDTMIKVKKNGENTIECTKLKDGEPWKPQKFTLIAKGPSVYVFWDGSVQNQQTKDEIISLLMAHPKTSFSVKDVKDGLTSHITPEAVRDALNNLTKQKITEKIDAGQGKRDRWRYKILDSYIAIQNALKP